MILSIIVPAYNVEKYIKKCINSLLEQDVAKEEYEIIVVNDGTKDASAEIVKEMAKIHSNIIVVDQENAGVSSARNNGIRQAKGKYTMFIDSDDFIEPNTLGQLISECEEYNLDMLNYNYRTINTKYEKVRFRSIGNVPKGVVSGIDYMLSNKFAVMIWCYIYRTSFLNENNLTFKNYGHEDEEFTPRAFSFCKRIKFINTVVYNYIKHDSSYMMNYKPRSIYDSMCAIKDLNDFIKSGALKDENAIRFIKKRINSIFYITLKRSIRKKVGLEKEMISLAKRDNLLHKRVYPNPKLEYCFMINYPTLFTSYYKLNYYIRNKK